MSLGEHRAVLSPTHKFITSLVENPGTCNTSAFRESSRGTSGFYMYLLALI